MRPVANCTAWWQRHMCINNLPKVITWQCPRRESNHWPRTHQSDTLELHYQATSTISALLILRDIRAAEGNCRNVFQMLVTGNSGCKLHLKLCLLFWTTIREFSLVVTISAISHCSVTCDWLIRNKWWTEFLTDICALYKLNLLTDNTKFVAENPGVN